MLQNLWWHNALRIICSMIICIECVHAISFQKSHLGELHTLVLLLKKVVCFVTVTIFCKTWGLEVSNWILNIFIIENWTKRLNCVRKITGALLIWLEVIWWENGCAKVILKNMHAFKNCVTICVVSTICIWWYKPH